MLNEKMLSDTVRPPIMQIFVGFCLLSALFLLAYDVTFAYKIPILVLLITLVGMPHGALDVMMIARLVRLSETKIDSTVGVNLSYWRRLCGYYLVYTGIAGLAFGFWLLFPSAALILFLVMAVSHFRYDWHGFGGGLMQISLSALVVTGPAVFHADAIAGYFQALFLSDQATSIIIVSLQSVALSAVLLALYAPKHSSSSRLLVLMLMSISVYCLDPLLFFIAYFCSLHSPLHTLSIKNEFDLSWPQLLNRVVPPMLITLLLMGLIYVLVPFQSVDAQWLRIIFIGLFALTVPHMFLTVYYQQTIRG